MLNYHKFLMKQYEVGSFPIVGKNCWSLLSYFYHFSLWLWWAKILYKGTAIAISTTLQMTLRWLTSWKGYGYDYQRLTYQSQSITFTVASHLVLSLLLFHYHYYYYDYYYFIYSWLKKKKSYSRTLHEKATTYTAVLIEIN